MGKHIGVDRLLVVVLHKDVMVEPIIPAWRQLQHSGTFIPLPMGISIDSRIFLAGFGRIMSSLHSSVTIAAKLRFVTASNCMKAGMVVKVRFCLVRHYFLSAWNYLWQLHASTSLA